MVADSSSYLAIDDRTVLLELLEEHVVSDVLWQVTNEAACLLAELRLRLEVASREGGLVPTSTARRRRLVYSCSRVAH